MEISRLADILKDEPKYRLAQAREAVFARLASDWNEATGLPAALREKLNREIPLAIEAELAVSDGSDSMKALIRLADGKFVESVLMRHEDGRNTVCVSCMVGCPMKCAFCATGELGLSRKLTADEIVSQVLYFMRLLKNENARVSGVVFMGMGEPFLNYDNCLAAIRTLKAKDGCGIGARHISVSTCGILDGILRFAEDEPEVNLAVSLHAPNDLKRRALMPVAHGYSREDLIRAVDEYIAKTRRRVMFEYLMIDGVNDTDADADELAALLRGKLCVVNLIQYNDTGVFSASSKNAMSRFKALLERKGISVSMRHKFGRDIKGACGQLAGDRAGK